MCWWSCDECIGFDWFGVYEYNHFRSGTCFLCSFYSWYIDRFVRRLSQSNCFHIKGRLKRLRPSVYFHMISTKIALSSWGGSFFARGVTPLRPSWRQPALSCNQRNGKLTLELHSKKRNFKHSYLKDYLQTTQLNCLLGCTVKPVIFAVHVLYQESFLCLSK